MREGGEQVYKKTPFFKTTPFTLEHSEMLIGFCSEFLILILDLSGNDYERAAKPIKIHWISKPIKIHWISAIQPLWRLGFIYLVLQMSRSLI